MPFRGAGGGDGLAFSADGAFLFVADSHPDRRVIWRFNYDRVRLQLNGRVIFADFRALGLEGTPDGAAIAADGSYWVAAHGHGKLLQFGRSVGEVDVQCKMVSKLAFVGDQLGVAAVTGFGSNLVFMDIGAKGLPLPRLNW